MGNFTGHERKFDFKFTIPAFIFIFGCVILSFVLRKIQTSNLHRNQTITELNAITYADRMTGDLEKGISITEAMKEIIISEGGNFNSFSLIAQDLMTPFIQSIQIAPKGVVTQIYPEKGNEAGKIDLINDSSRGEISRYSRDNNVTIMQGPFQLNQGGFGIAIRTPVFLKDENDVQFFWGFTIAIIRVPEIFEHSINALATFGYDYRLSKTISPLHDEYHEIMSSGNKLEDPFVYDFKVKDCSFKLEVMPSGGWKKNGHILLFLSFGFMIIILLTGLTIFVLILESHRKILKTISVTDPLTKLPNRKGFDEEFRLYLKNSSDPHFVGIQLDIDDFKFINDIYGHAAGDLALQCLAKNIHDSFSENSILCRNGGDEFSIILKDSSIEKSRHLIEDFTDTDRFFLHDGITHPFFISLGYAEFTCNAKSSGDFNEEAVDVLKKADIALYEAKMQGKNKCLQFKADFKLQKRSQLGFSLKDISKNLPGSFLIYKADLLDDTILFANHELIAYSGCKNFDEFLSYSNHSFRNLIRPDQQKSIEKSIWKQIDGNKKKNGTNDYVQFDFVKKDGTFHPVLDHGRIVDSAYYGKAFYVMIMDCELIQNHYER